MRSLSIALILMSTPVDACHRFSVWKYPTPQHCSVARVQLAADQLPAPPERPKQLAPFTVSKYDTIILTPQPGRTDEEGRAQAIEILKEVMGK